MSLELSGVSAGYNGMTVVQSATMSFEGGTITGIIGPNGAGKSTLLKALFGGAQLMGGAVRINGELLERVTPRELLARRVSYVPQLRNVFPSLSVRENLEMGIFGARSKAIGDVVDVFPELRVLLKRQAGRLSGGERNMVAVARALMSNPEILLVDEGSAGLAPQVVASYWKHLASLIQLGVGVVVVEQNVSVVLEFAQRMYLLVAGRVSLEGSAQEFAARDDLAALFLGGSPAPQPLTA